MRMMFARTAAALRNGRKTVTRRLGWERLEPGAHVEAHDGRGNTLGTLVVLSVRREPLADITDEEVGLEGFPGRSAAWFIDGFAKMHRLAHPQRAMVTRIEFRFEPAPERQTSMW